MVATFDPESFEGEAWGTLSWTKNIGALSSAHVEANGPIEEEGKMPPALIVLTQIRENLEGAVLRGVPRLNICGRQSTVQSKIEDDKPEFEMT
jgi:hypothetical protein